jgi:hypothetical protein
MTSLIKYIFSQVIMMLYVKGFKIDRQKVTDIVEAEDREDPLIDAGICVIVLEYRKGVRVTKC